MKTMMMLVMLAAALTLLGCGQHTHDPRVNLADTVGSDHLGSNIITRPVGQIFSAVVGEGIVIQNVSQRVTPHGFLEVQVQGLNQSHSIRRFDYQVEWLDAGGMAIPTKTSVWQPVSVQPKSPFAFRAVAPRTEAVDFRINTRTQPR
ncbi:MAG TPA: DUF1425 domain-containing protein [Phycisphaerales bacterium]|nr:DUF1425 domain-containing protein [Phycisphaerales bacterium]